jgi:hypothetical protein
MFLARTTAAIQSFSTLCTCLAISTMRIVIKDAKMFLTGFPSLPAEEAQMLPCGFYKTVGREIEQTVDQTKDFQNPVNTHHGNCKTQNFVDWMKFDSPSPCAMTCREGSPYAEPPQRIRGRDYQGYRHQHS